MNILKHYKIFSNYYIIASALFLLFTAFAKLSVIFVDTSTYLSITQKDPVIYFLTIKTLLVIVGLLEVVLAIFLLWRKIPEIYKYYALFGLGVCFIVYREFRVYAKANGDCGCLGKLPTILGSGFANYSNVMLIVIAFMWIFISLACVAAYAKTKQDKL